MRIIWLATAGITAALGAGIWMSNPMDNGNESYQGASLEYIPRKHNQDARLAGGNKEINFLLRRNVNTGNVEKQDYLDALAATQAMPSMRVTNLTWVDRGPDNIGGRTRAIQIDVTNPSHVWAGSVSGGLFESFDSGNNWTKVNSFTENLSISSMCQTPNGNLYVATGHAEEGISGNGDSGGFGNGVYLSTDGGASFSLVSGTSSFTYINEIVADPRVTDRVWFITSNSPGIRVYEHGGAGLQTAAAWGATGIPSAAGWFSLDISTDGTVLVGSASGAGGLLTYASTDGGLTWAEYSGNGVNEVPSAGVGRIEYAISRTKNSSGAYNIYASMATNGGAFAGARMSNDNGVTWYEIAPNTSSQNPSNPGAFTPFSTSLSNQGNYNNIITVDPNDPERVFLGGIDVYEWNQGSNNPPFGQWDQKSLWFASPTSPIYVHADNHEFKWDPAGFLWIGNDGGIGKSPPGAVNGDIFFPSNRGYNVTQFYSVAFSKEGWVMGGTQDNGTILNDGTGTTSLEFDEVRGGDGFDCDISHINSDIFFASVYNGDMQRSDDRGVTWGPFFSNALSAVSSQAGFYTTGRLWENPNDLNSLDSVIFLPFATLLPGDTVPNLTSATGQIPLEYVLGVNETLCFADTLEFDGVETDSVIIDAITGITFNLDTVSYFVINTDSLFNSTTSDTLVIDSLWLLNNYWAFSPCVPTDTVWMGAETTLFDVPIDTLKVADPIQSWYAFGIGGSNGVWITRQALRFNVTPNWYKVAGGTDPNDGAGMSTVKSLEFSADGNHLYIGTWGGEVYRVSGLASIYASDPDALGKTEVGSPTRTVTTTRVYRGNNFAAITGIAVDPQDPGHVVLTIGGFGTSSHVLETFTADVDAATSGTGSFNSIQGNLPDMPAYDAIIDRNDNNMVVVGTEMGVWVTDNAGSGNTWVQASGDFGNTPVYAVRQQWRTWNDGAQRPGEIYIGTHGRGIWASGTVLGLPGDPGSTIQQPEFVSELMVFPNPMTTEGQVSFKLSAVSDVEMRITTIMGELVERKALGRLANGTHTFDMNTSGYGAGTYIIEIDAAGSRSVGKFIVSK